jgi:hypothetical protein
MKIELLGQETPVVDLALKKTEEYVEKYLILYLQ